MISVSDDFKTAMKQPIKEIDAYIQISEDNKIISADDLISFKISCDTGMCKTAMRKLEVKYLGERNLLGQWVHIGFGVKLPTGAFEYLDYGSFLVTEITTIKDTGVTTIVGYDKMINSMKEYQVLNIEYPINLYTYTQKLCESCGLELANTSFLTHNDWQIIQELWENINGITYRDIFVQIAQVTATTCIISNDDKIYFKPINITGEQLTYDNMLKLKLEPIYGEINSVVLSRTPQEDNIYMRDEDSIQSNGLTEYKIENNEIIDKDRDNAIVSIYNALHGISYYPFETTTEGLGWYEIGDSFEIINDIGYVFNTSLFNFSITIDGGIKEILKTVANTKTQTQYQYATTITKRLKNAEIIVNKQENTIKEIVQEVEANSEKVTQIETTVDGVSTEIKDKTNEVESKITNIEETINGMITEKTTIGGQNLIKNSVGYFEHEYWQVSDEQEGQVTRNTTSDVKQNSISGSALELQKETIYQNITEIKNGEYYLSFRYKKLEEKAICTFKINEIEINLNDNNWVEIERLIIITNNTIRIEMSTDINSSCLITDLLLTEGNVKTSWTQNANESYTDGVQIGKGLKIKSTGTDTEFEASADGIVIKNSNNNQNVAEFTKYGTETEELTVNKDIKITNALLIQKVGNQVWFCSL